MATTSVMLAVAAAIALNPFGPDTPANLKQVASSEKQASTAQVTQNPVSSTKNLPSSANTSTQRGRLITRTQGSWINIRSQPTTYSSSQAYGISGDEVTILAVRPGINDSYRWYDVQFPVSQIRGWVREDLILELAPATPTNDDLQNNAAISAPAPEQRQTVVPPSSATAYTPEQISYFTEIALGSEFGNASQRVRKWNNDIHIKVHGTPTRADRQTLEGIVNELNTLINYDTSDGIRVEIVSDRNASQANINIYFVPQTEFSRYEPNYQAGNMGFAYVNWDNDRIYQARVLITTEGVTQTERSHLIREELTQSLGLLRDSYRYSDSIFYQGWTSTNTYTDLDRAVIQMLYSHSINPGMNSYQARAALEQASTVAAKTSHKNPLTRVINHLSAQR